MKKLRLLKIFIFLLFLFPKVTLGLAGFAESNTECYFTPQIIIDFGNPSDMCSANYGDQTCFNLYYFDDRYKTKGFENLDNLIEIGFPTLDNPEFIIGKSYFNENWIIYDIKKDKKIVENKKYKKVLADWKKLGNSEPVIVNTENFSEYFDKETEESKRIKDEEEKFASVILLVFFSVLIIPLIIFGLIIFLIIYIVKKIKQKNIKNIKRE